MPALAEIRESYGAALKSVKQLRDEWHAARDAKKPQSELDAIKTSLAEARTKLDTAKAQFDAETEVDELDQYISDAERDAKLSTRRGKTKPGRDDIDSKTGDHRDENAVTDEERTLHFHAWAMRQAGLPISPRHKAAVAKVRSAGVRAGKSLSFSLSPTSQFRAVQQMFRATHPSLIGSPDFQKRTMSSLIGSAGGFAVSNGFISQLEINQLHYSGVMQLADYLRTARGDEIPWPTADDTSNEGAQIGQSASLGLTGGGTNPTLDKITFRAYKIHSTPIGVPYELLEDWDAAPSFEQFLNQIMAERLGRHRNRKYTLGTGNGEPMGLVTAATLGRTAGSATVITGDDFLRLISSLDTSQLMNAAFMMHKSIFLEVQLLKDGQGQYLHTPGITAGARDVIRGYPVFDNTHMDSALATGNKIATFGNHSKYKIREVAQVRLKRFDELGADNDEILFDALQRHDGNLLDAGTAPVKYLQMA